MYSRVLSAICTLTVFVLLAFVGSHEARAQNADALKRAQSAFDQAQLDYLQGNYDKAAQGFQDAYSARQFPQFLYNVASSYYMKAKKDGDEPSYEKAVEYYRRYLQEQPEATDKAKVEKAIGVLEGEIKRLKDLAAQGSAAGSGSDVGSAGSGSGSDAASGSGGSGAITTAPHPPTPSEDVKALGDAKVHGLVVIESEPQNASIYFDDRKNA